MQAAQEVADILKEAVATISPPRAGRTRKCHPPRHWGSGRNTDWRRAQPNSPSRLEGRARAHTTLRNRSPATARVKARTNGRIARPIPRIGPRSRHGSDRTRCGANGSRTPLGIRLRISRNSAKRWSSYRSMSASLPECL